ncbi:MAG: hypothetical protein MUE42_07515 [Opitutaceae bacterium]|jgi:hypothetical protein|nr:hypothetical protein [Opitutaceae bacterium]
MIVVGAVDHVFYGISLLVGGLLLLAIMVPAVGDAFGDLLNAVNGFSGSLKIPFLEFPEVMVGALVFLIVGLFFGWIVLHLAVAIYVAVSGRRMHLRRHHGWVTAGAWVLIISSALGMLLAFSSPAGVLTVFWRLIKLGIGIWALVVLRQPAVREAFKANPAPAGARASVA